MSVLNLDRRAFIGSTLAASAGIGSQVQRLIEPAKKPVITCEFLSDGPRPSWCLNIVSDAWTLREIFDGTFRKVWAVTGHDYDELWPKNPRAVEEREKAFKWIDINGALLVSGHNLGSRYDGRCFHHFAFDVIDQMERSGAIVKHIGDDPVEEAVSLARPNLGPVVVHVDTEAVKNMKLIGWTVGDKVLV